MERDVASAAAAALLVQSGANIVRTHNVAFTRDAVAVAAAVGWAQAQLEMRALLPHVLQAAMSLRRKGNPHSARQQSLPWICLAIALGLNTMLLN